MRRIARPALALTLALAACLGAPATAQEVPEPAGEPAAGEVPLAQASLPPGVPLSSGFTPDPVRLEGQTGSSTPLSARAPGCRGYVGEAPDQVLRLESRFGFLRLFVTALGDVTLAVRRPDGTWRCSGRPLYGAPREQGAFEPGTYEVWIGSVRPEERHAYTLHVTEFQSVTPQTRLGTAAIDGTGVDIGLAVDAAEGRFRGRRLRPGFLPDPRQDGGFAGGPLSASLLGAGCRGYVHPQPGHVVQLGGPRCIGGQLAVGPGGPRCIGGELVIERFAYFRVHVRQADEPVTMIIRTPSGGYLCSSPDSGLPSIEQDSWPDGQYRIWIGTRSPGRDVRYRIEHTETRARAE